MARAEARSWPIGFSSTTRERSPIRPNLLALRFANTIFERLWNADVIDHVQITVAETVGVGPRTVRIATSWAGIGLRARRTFSFSSRTASASSEPDRDLRGPEARADDAALGRRAVLPTHRQAAAPEASSLMPSCGCRRITSRFGSRANSSEKMLNGEERNRYPDAYERLLMDVVRGNATLFMRRDEVEAAWAWASNEMSRPVARRRIPPGPGSLVITSSLMPSCGCRRRCSCGATRSRRPGPGPIPCWTPGPTVPSRRAPTSVPCR
jgi:hypothetical protein